MMLLPLSLALALSLTAALGGEKVSFFSNPQVEQDISHRQNVCDRHEQFRSGQIALKNALAGLQLNVHLGNYEGSYFNYDDTTGIDRNYPGLAAVILDELAKKADFTWRNSFGIYDDPANYNTSWSNMLEWSVDNYDLSVDWWGHNLERMLLGVAFLEGWLDSSLILIAKQPKLESENEINLWNWLRPYDPNVWMMTILTILLSALVYQVLEWYADERDERTLWEWSLENVYLSTINATQAYEYQPKTLSSRIFGMSMAVWALVMTATYTANLASLLVDRSDPPPGPQTIEEVVAFKYTICTWKDTLTDIHIKDNFRSAIRIEKPTLLEVYQGLQNGECDFLVDSVASWNRQKSIQAFNPECDLSWVGGDRIIKEYEAGFATKADSGNLCSGFIRDVLNVHMHDLMDSGFLEEAWAREYQITQDIYVDCTTYKPFTNKTSNQQSKNGGRTLASTKGTNHDTSGSKGTTGGQRALKDRLLKAGTGATGGAVAIAASSATGGSEDERSLSVEQMIGTFVFHWGLMALALLLASINALYIKYWGQTEKFVETSMEHTPLESSDSAAKESVHRNSDSVAIANGDTKDEIQDLRRQLTVMQLHLQQFEQTVIGELGSMRRQIGREASSLNAKSSSLACGEMPIEMVAKERY